MLRAVATNRGEAEGELIQARLSGAGIGAVYKPNVYTQAGDVLVEEADLERAHALLSEQEFSDEELAELSTREPPPTED